MPGIVGLITRMPRVEAEDELRRMVAALCHEPSYQSGTWRDASLGVYAGWVARPGSACAAMPLCNETGDMTLLFSGEEYPERGTAQRLREHGHEVAGDGPGYLVHVAEEDPAFPAGLNGRFHGLLIDQARGLAKLFSDRYSMHRLYYHQSKDAFHFAAEAKAILAVRPELRGLDPRGLGEYLACGCVLEDRTLFPGIRVLPGGSAWTFCNAALERQGRYFHPGEWEHQETLAPEAYYQELRRVFSERLPRYLAGGGVGMSLTGGLDTRMIMAWGRAERGALPCYTFAGPYRDSQDVRVARQVAAACGQPHQTIRVGSDFLSRFPEYAERTVYLSDGCVSVGHAPDLYVNEIARQIAPVRMTGNYGGEVLRRVRAFKPEEPLPGLFPPELLNSMRQAHETYAGLVSEHPLTFAVFRQAPWHHHGLLALEQTQLAMRTPFLDNELVRTVYRAPQSTLNDDSLSRRLIADGSPALARIRSDRGGGHGATAPLRRAFHRFTFKAEYAYNHGMPQWLARVDYQLGPLHLERLFLGRHKFTHFRVWYRDPLAKYVRRVLLDPRALSRPYVEKQRLQAVVTAHVKGYRNYTQELHRVLTLELLHRHLFESGRQPFATAEVQADSTTSRT